MGGLYRDRGYILVSNAQGKYLPAADVTCYVHKCGLCHIRHFETIYAGIG